MLLPRHALRTCLRPSLPSRSRIPVNGARQPLRCIHGGPPAAEEVSTSATGHVLHFLDNGVVGVQTAIEQLHAVSGLPWYATIPLTAVLVRCLMLPLFTIPSRKAEQRRLDVAPLMQAYAELSKMRGPKHAENMPPAFVRRRVRSLIRNQTNRLKKRWSCTWRSTVFLPLMQLPIFITIQEAIRRITGSHSSLLGLAINSISPKQAENLDDALDTPSLTNVATDWIAPTMKTEGCLWFTDLTAADPYAILSFGTSAVMFFHIWRSVRRDSLHVLRTTGLSRVTKISLIMACAVAFITHKMPSGIMLYWLSSSVSTAVSGLVMERKIPLKRPPVNLIARKLEAQRAAAKKKMTKTKAPA